MHRTALAALTAVVLAATPALAADSATSTLPVTPHYTTLSNRTTLTRWAYTNLDTKVRKSPSPTSKVIGKLHFNTEDRRPEIYLALQMYTDAEGNEWVQTQLPGRPNGRIGWVPREGLGEFHVTTTQIVVNRRTLRLTVFRNGKRVFRAPIGVGKSSTPTPAGPSWIRERLNGFNNPVYGPLAFGTGSYSRLSEWPGGGVIGIHGTNEPNLIPGRPSHGCIRMKNRDILRLDKLMKPGTPLLIK